MEGRRHDLMQGTIARFVSGKLRKSATNLSRDGVVGTLTIVRAERSGVRIPAGPRALSLVNKANLVHNFS